MADYPDSVRQKAYAARYGEPVDTYTWDRVASAVLDAVAADLGNAVAQKILAHMEAHQPADGSKGGRAAQHRWRRHLGIAARVAAGAFLTEEDKLRMAATALAAGNYVACQAPEDGDERLV